MATKSPGSRATSLLSKLTTHRRWRPEEVREVLDAHRRSGVSLVAFARRHGLEVKRLYWWRRRLKSAPGPTRPTAVRFLPVAVRPVESAPARIEILLRGGRRLRVGADCDLGWLGQMVRLLEALPC
jgi:transposase